MNDTITTKLRAAMNVDREYTMGGDLVARVYCMGRDEFADLCDAIDAAHANLEAENESLRRELDRVLGEHEDRDGLVRLPVDADGECIRVGDKMDGYGKTIEVVELRIGRSGWVIVSRDGNAYADTSAFAHHKPPTVEDVLREFAVEVCGEPALTIRSGVVEEYASRLRLAGES